MTELEPTDELSGSRKKDQRLIRSAIRNGWAIPDAAKAKIVVKILDTVGAGDVPANADPKPRLLLAVTKTLAALDRLALEERRVEAVEAGRLPGDDQVDVDLIERAKAIRDARRARE